MKKVLITVIVVITIVAMLMLTGCKDAPTYVDADLNFDGLGSKPNATASAGAVPVDQSKIVLSADETTDQAVLDSIVYLIDLSNHNNINANFYAAAAYGAGDAQIDFGSHIVGSMGVRDWRIYDNGEYFFDSYGLVYDAYTLKDDGSHGTVAKSLVSAISGVLNYTKRIYSPDSETFYVSTNGKTDENSFVNFPSIDAIKYEKPNSTEMTYSKFLTYNFSLESYKEYSSDNLLADNPINSGTLTYDAEKGLYTLSCSLNCVDSDVLDLSTKSMIDSCGSKQFKYVEKNITLEIWECGLIRRYYNTNKWEATLLPKSFKVHGTSDSYYEQLFTYNKEDLKILNAPDEYKQALVK